MAESAAAVKSAMADANYKETVESILVAFILAFIFRAFVVEAFVIPTGSMATTLYGAHMRFTCPDCGYVYDVGYNGGESESGDDIDVPAEARRPNGIHCPNCGNELGGGHGDKIMEPVRFGDRILVLKYLYLFSKPQHWDVVVFKSPSEQRHHVPYDAEYPQNYIKRLIATPNESAVILDGDIYIGPYAAQGVDSSGNLLPDALSFKIQRKPEYVQDRLWRIAYDNDFIPRRNLNEGTWHQPWKPVVGTGWNLGTETAPSRVFHFDNAGGSGEVSFNPEANSGIYPLREWTPYDQREAPLPGNWVSDIKLSCFYTRHAGDGPMRLTLTKLDQAFVAEIKPGTVTLYRSTVTKSGGGALADEFATGPQTVVATKPLELKQNVPVQVEFMNYDYRVSVKIDGKEIISQEYDPNMQKLWKEGLQSFQGEFARPEVRIACDHQTASIEHLSLWRDIYYGNNGDAKDYKGVSIGRFWGTPRNVIHLGPTEYFVLGDNSPISGDARYWGDPVNLPQEGINTQGGRVPEQFMLGKAFFVYWPAGYPIKMTSINGVPDFGEMRFIH